MKKISTILLCTAPLLFSPLANAQEGNIGLGLGVKAGTTGLGLEITKSIGDTLVLRGSYNMLDYDLDINDTDIDYKANIKKNSLSAGVDWHPWAGKFHFSAAVYNHSDNKMKLQAKPSPGATFEFNGVFYDADQIDSVNADVQFGDTSPYIGIGWSSPPGEYGFGFVADLGLQFQNSPSVAFIVSGCTLPENLCTQLNSDINAERLELEEDLEDFNFWPTLNIGFSYKF